MKELDKNNKIKYLLKLYEEKKFLELESITLELTKIDPNEIAYWNLLGASQNLQRKFEEAIKSFQQTCIINPRQKENYANLATAYQDNGDLDNAIENFQKFLKIDPNNAQIIGKISHIYIGKREPIKVREFAEKALEIEKKAEYYYCLSESYSLSNDLEKTAHFLKKCLSLEPNLPIGLYKFGLLLFKSGRYSDAAKSFMKSKYADWEERYLQSLYMDESFSEYKEYIKKFLNKPNISPLIQSISSHAELNFQKDEEYNFCKNPMKMILHEKVSELNDDKKFLNQIINDIRNPKIVTIPQDLLHNGKQSENRLLDYKNIQSFKKLRTIILDKIFSYKEQFSESKCDLIRYWPERYRLNSWYIDMKNEGFLDPHIHELGWLSGSIYLNIPKNIKGNDGNIEFSLGTSKFPKIKSNISKKNLNLSTGDIVIFPSSLFHKTIPFSSDEKRLCIAFDFRSNEGNF